MVETAPRICVLGGGFGGLYTALYLSHYRWPQSASPRITLVDQKDHFLFTPLLYELVTEELQPWEIAPAFRRLLAHTNVRFCQETVQGVDLDKRQVQLQGGEVLAYDRLALAVGRKTLLDVVPGAAVYAYAFRTLADVERLQERLRSLEASNHNVRIAIAGGGPSGVELACKLADRLQRQGRICLIDRGEQILQDFSPPSREAVCRALAARRVRVELETNIKAVNFDSLTLVREGQTQTIPVDLVIWTAGTQAWEWVPTLTCQHNSQGQLLTLPTLQLPDYPDVFSLGDLAEIRDAQGKSVPTTAQAAWQQAKVAAWNLRASLVGRPLFSFRYRHQGEMLSLGKNKAAVVSSFGLRLEGLLAYMARQWVYLLRMPTLYHRLQVGRHWLVTLVLRGLIHSWQQLRSLIFRWLPGNRRRSVPVSRWQQAHRRAHRQHSSSKVARKKVEADYQSEADE
jgi:NADH dehydrogenase